METQFNDIFGQDILLDQTRQAVIAANGELAWADGETAAIQDIRLRMLTPLGGLFYDKEFGSRVPDFIHDDNTKTNRLSLQAEVIRCLEKDARVLAGSVNCKILKWDEKGLTLAVSWVFWETETPQNLTVTLERPQAAGLVEDVNYGD